MSYMEWNESYSVGIASLDAQHRGLLATANRLHQAMCAGRAAQIQQQILAEIFEYARSHFAREEAVMESAAFPGLAAHRLKHQAFTERVCDFQAQLRACRGALPVEMMDFLRVWMKEHILTEDAQYGQWIRRSISVPLPKRGTAGKENQCHS